MGRMLATFLAMASQTMPILMRVLAITDCMRVVRSVLRACIREDCRARLLIRRLRDYRSKDTPLQMMDDSKTMMSRSDHRASAVLRATWILDSMAREMLAVWQSALLQLDTILMTSFLKMGTSVSQGLPPKFIQNLDNILNCPEFSLVLGTSSRQLTCAVTSNPKQSLLKVLTLPMSTVWQVLGTSSSTLLGPTRCSPPSYTIYYEKLAVMQLQLRPYFQLSRRSRPPRISPRVSAATVRTHTPMITLFFLIMLCLHCRYRINLNTISHAHPKHPTLQSFTHMKPTKLQFLVCHNSQCHKIQPPILNYHMLTACIKGVFSSLPANYALSYIDEDGDMIVLMNQYDLGSLVATGVTRVRVEVRGVEQSVGGREGGGKSAKKWEGSVSQLVQSLQAESQNSKSSVQPYTRTQHPKTNCIQCKASPITGIRYKCVFCPIYDLCERCEQKSEHRHPMLKIRDPKMAPVAIYTIVGEEESERTSTGEKKEDRLSTLVDLVKDAKKDEASHEKTEKRLIQVQEQGKSPRPEPRQSEHARQLLSDSTKLEPTKQPPIAPNQQKKTGKKQLSKIDAATFLAEETGIDLVTSYKFVEKFFNLRMTQEQLLQKYRQQ